MKRLESVINPGIFAVALVGLAAAVCTPPALAGGTPLTLRQMPGSFSDPILVTAPPGDLERIFVVEQFGRIQIIPCDGPTETGTVFLNINSKVAGPSFMGDERGLLGLAFDPDYQNNGFFYVNYFNNSGQTVIERYTVSSNPYVADGSTGTTVFGPLTQPFSNHNGGWIEFGPNDGYLYVGLGDGGSGGDPGNRAQTGTNLLGKILRLDVSTVPASVPASNPFVGTPSVRDEVWALGVRNPWRCSFDRANGDLYIGDVGQVTVEEISYQPASSSGGENYGWRLKEGNLCFNPSTNCDPGGLTDPIHTYGRSNGCSITGGYVYRGEAITDLVGTYFLGDYCSERVWSFKVSAGSVTNFQERTSELSSQSRLSSLPSFGQDGRGELYLTSNGNDRVFKLVSAETPEVEVAMSPQSTSVPRGDRLRFDIAVENNTGQPKTIDGWMEAYLPNGTPANQNPINGPKTVNLDPNEMINVSANLRIPNNAPTDRFIIKINLGTFPNKIDDSACFSFTVTP